MSPEKRIRELAKEHSIAPSGLVIATSKPMEVNEVILFSGFRFVVSEELTRDEFDGRVKRNAERRLKQEREMGFQTTDRPGQGSFRASVEASNMRESAYADAPSADAKYFYQMRRL